MNSTTPITPNSPSGRTPTSGKKRLTPDDKVRVSDIRPSSEPPPQNSRAGTPLVDMIAVSNKSSSGVLDMEEELCRLLQGTGLTAPPNSPNEVSICPSENPST